MRKSRTPGSTKSKRSDESAKYRRQWEKEKRHNRRRCLDEAGDAFTLLAELHERMGQTSKALELTLRMLKALGLDGKYWRRNLSKLPNASGRNPDLHVLLYMQFAIENDGWKLNRAAQRALAESGLFPHMTWASAVKHCCKLWARYKSGDFLDEMGQRRGELTIAGGEPTWGHFSHICGLPYADSFTVENTAFWRKAIKSGIVNQLADNEGDDFWVKVMEKRLVLEMKMEENEVLLVPTLHL
ncbi:hypothetical protein [Hyphomicrobium sp.]|jgi:hypothetical protein|uniref:hypothetical protein n=1 Tax=Hyphomicrobium sp. TaxID=82 RepID=UPI00356503C1